MAKEKGLPGGTAMLLLSLLDRRDMYGLIHNVALSARFPLTARTGDLTLTLRLPFALGSLQYRRKA